MDGYIFLPTVSDWDKLLALQTSGELRAVARIAAGPWAAIAAYSNKTPVQVLELKDKTCQGPETTCTATVALPPIIILPFLLFVWEVAHLIEWVIDPPRTQEFLDFARAEGVGALTALHGSLTHHVLGEVTHEDEAEVARITSVVTSHPAVQSFRVSVTGRDLMVGHGTIGHPPA